MAGKVVVVEENMIATEPGLPTGPLPPERELCRFPLGSDSSTGGTRFFSQPEKRLLMDPEGLIAVSLGQRDASRYTIHVTCYC